MRHSAHQPHLIPLSQGENPLLIGSLHLSASEHHLHFSEQRFFRFMAKDGRFSLKCALFHCGTGIENAGAVVRRVLEYVTLSTARRNLMIADCRCCFHTPN